MAYAKLDVHNLNKAIEQTKKAIQRGRDLLEVAAGHPTVKGLQDVAESTPKIIEKLEQDLKKLEKELEKKSGK